MAQIKELTDSELEDFQQRGQIEILGHVLTTQDLKVNLY